ncbi:MAG: hypothetical protein KJ814_00845, partial [Proteobacteria bacterium]|nr:hypothetical protein [Pseudomonadota bacterium]
LEQKVAMRTAALREALTEKERTQEQLIRSESLAAIGQLVAGTAHELNNPIAGAMSLVETSVDTIGGWEVQKGDREEVVDDLRFSLGELRRAGAIIRSLLDLSRQTQTYTETVDINRAVDDALRVLYNQYKNLPVEIAKDYDDTSPVGEGKLCKFGTGSDQHRPERHPVAPGGERADYPDDAPLFDDRHCPHRMPRHGQGNTRCLAEGHIQAFFYDQNGGSGNRPRSLFIP